MIANIDLHVFLACLLGKSLGFEIRRMSDSNEFLVRKHASSSLDHALQRLGYLLDHVGHGELTGPLQESLKARGLPPWTELDRMMVTDPYFVPEVLQRDEQWRIIVRCLPQVDE